MREIRQQHKVIQVFQTWEWYHGESTEYFTDRSPMPETPPKAVRRAKAPSGHVEDNVAKVR